MAKWLSEDLHTIMNLVLRSNSNLGNQIKPSEIVILWWFVHLSLLALNHTTELWVVKG